MRDISEEDKLSEKWISAKMLAKVLEVRTPLYATDTFSGANLVSYKMCRRLVQRVFLFLCSVPWHTELLLHGELKFG